MNIINIYPYKKIKITPDLIWSKLFDYSIVRAKEGYTCSNYIYLTFDVSHILEHNINKMVKYFNNFFGVKYNKNNVVFIKKFDINIISPKFIGYNLKANYRNKTQYFDKLIICLEFVNITKELICDYNKNEITFIDSKDNKTKKKLKI